MAATYSSYPVTSGHSALNFDDSDYPAGLNYSDTMQTAETQQTPDGELRTVTKVTTSRHVQRVGRTEHYYTDGPSADQYSDRPHNYANDEVMRNQLNGDYPLYETEDPGTYSRLQRYTPEHNPYLGYGDEPNGYPTGTPQQDSPRGGGYPPGDYYPNDSTQPPYADETREVYPNGEYSQQPPEEYHTEKPYGQSSTEDPYNGQPRYTDDGSQEKFLSSDDRFPVPVGEGYSPGQRYLPAGEGYAPGEFSVPGEAYPTKDPRYSPDDQGYRPIYRYGPQDTSVEPAHDSSFPPDGRTNPNNYPPPRPEDPYNQQPDAYDPDTPGKYGGNDPYGDTRDNLYAQQPPLEDPYNQHPVHEDPYSQQPPTDDSYNQQPPINDSYQQQPVADPYNPQSPGDDPYHQQPSYNQQNPLDDSYLQRPADLSYEPRETSYPVLDGSQAPPSYSTTERPLVQEQAQGLRASPTPSIDSQTKDQMWRDPTLQEVIDYLNHPSNNIKANAAAYLQHLCFHDNDMKTKTRELGGIPRLVELLSNEIPEVHRNASGALRNLSYGRANDGNKKEILRCGGIPALVRLLKRTPEQNVRELVTAVLWNLSPCEELKRPIIDEGLTTIVNVVIIPNSGWDRNRPSELRWTTVFRNATGCLRNVSSAEVYARTKLRQCEGLVDALFHVVRAAVGRNDMDNKAVENCVCVLRSLSYRVQETDDPDYEKKRPPPHVANEPADKDKTPGCFGKKSKGIEERSRSSSGYQSKRGYPSAKENASGQELLWQPNVVNVYLPLLAEGSNPETLEAAAGAIQNLTACYWQPAVDLRVAVKREKGLPTLVSLLDLENDRVVCSAANALRNLAIDQKNRELIGKYTMQQLVAKIPNEHHSGQPSSDDTVSAILATLFEVVRKNAEFANSLLKEGGLERLMHVTKSRGKYTSKVVTFAAQVLFVMWGFKELHPEYKRRGYSSSDFIIKTMTARKKSGKEAPYDSTLYRPRGDPGGRTGPVSTTPIPPRAAPVAHAPPRTDTLDSANYPASHSEKYQGPAPPQQFYDQRTLGYDERPPLQAEPQALHGSMGGLPPAQQDLSQLPYERQYSPQPEAYPGNGPPYGSVQYMGDSQQNLTQGSHQTLDISRGSHNMLAPNTQHEPPNNGNINFGYTDGPGYNGPAHEEFSMHNMSQGPGYATLDIQQPGYYPPQSDYPSQDSREALYARVNKPSSAARSHSPHLTLEADVGGPRQEANADSWV